MLLFHDLIQLSVEDFTMYGGVFGNKQDSVFRNLEVCGCLIIVGVGILWSFTISFRINFEGHNFTKWAKLIHILCSFGFTAFQLSGAAAFNRTSLKNWTKNCNKLRAVFNNLLCSPALGLNVVVCRILECVYVMEECTVYAGVVHANLPIANFKLISIISPGTFPLLKIIGILQP